MGVNGVGLRWGELKVRCEEKWTNKFMDLELKITKILQSLRLRDWLYTAINAVVII